MSLFRKTMFMLAVGAILLCVPLTAAADEELQISPVVSAALACSKASLSAPGTAGADSVDLVVASQAPLRASTPTENFVLPDGRSHLRSFCLLRC